MALFKDDIIQDYIRWQTANPNSFTWWSYVNMKADIKTALAFAEFFYPDVIEKDGNIFLKDHFSIERYNGWKEFCKNDKKSLQIAMNSYEIQDFFHIHTDYDDEYIDEQIDALGNVLKLFWSLSFKDRFPDKQICVELFDEDEAEYITVYEKE